MSSRKFLEDSVATEAQKWIDGQKLKLPTMKGSSVFYRNLEEALDSRRSKHNLTTLHNWSHTIDFSSNDFLSLSTSGLLRTAFLEELSRNPDFVVGATGSRLTDGNTAYLENLEKDIAKFHGAESALVLNCGYDGNCSIFNAIPKPGDAIVYDELVHASMHDGMKFSLAQTQVSFRHNNVESLRERLVEIQNSQPLIRQGQRCVLIAVETVYSMDGDVAPLEEFVEVAKEIFPNGNAQFIVDEAHSTGLMGRQGSGLVCALGLEKDIAIRMHTYGKGMGTTGAAILCNETVRTMIVNFARPIIYTTAPSFPMLAAIRAGYTLMQTGQIEPQRERLQYLVKYFYNLMTSNPVWDKVMEAGICSIPLVEDWEARQFITQFVPLWTREQHNLYLTMHLQWNGIRAIPINPPVVPRGTGRVRIIIHAQNTEAQVEKLAAAICEWGQEMYQIETGRAAGVQIPTAMRLMYSLMAVSETKPKKGSAKA